ncbi:L-rhamnose mutarotase [Flavicella sediminum]|uniref:L-rhamnose mutarotase n=1 Tax=Flavicella sediminum TaxID=2585141 RepID=UPI0011205A63|nr:L-rhamnose mutarotase [Flavicella sediminum]
MIRKVFKMKLLPNNLEEYTKRHNPIWLELYDMLKEYGVTNYSISLDEETNSLFAYAEIASEEMWAAISKTEICKKWWEHMAFLMETNEDNSPVATELKEVFYME